MPYRVATLIYGFDTQDRVLLLHRTQEPNRGLWSPCGGKLRMELGESPHACACREAREEAGLALTPPDLHLTGLVSEYGYAGTAHWLMFLFEVKPRLTQLPPPHPEGAFRFFSRAEVDRLEAVPETDRERIWPLFWRHRGGFFAAHCRCEAGAENRWEVEESVESGSGSVSSLETAPRSQ